MNRASLVDHGALAGSGRSPAEFDLICALAGVDLAPARVARASALMDAGVDWNALLRQAEHHGVVPLLARNLTPCADKIPAVAANFFRPAFAKNLQRNLWFTSETARILEHLVGCGIRAVPYKGPVLAESVYGDVALRSFGDLDFLIAPGDFRRARAALAEIGYRPAKTLTPAEDQFWLRKGYECSFDGESGKYLVELQWRLLPPMYAIDLPAEELLDRSRRVPFCGTFILTLSPEDSLLVLCLHAAKHLWTRLIWVCDIAETMRAQTLDYAVVGERARSLGVSRILGASMWLAHRLLGSTVPEVGQEILARDPAANVIAAAMADRLAQGAGYDFESTEYFRWISRLRERRSDRYRYWWRLVWTPGEGDVNAVRLPAALFPLYRAVRLARLVGKVA